MSAPIRLAVVTTSRSDFGLLEPVLLGALKDPRFEVTLIVCGQHLRAGTPLPHETAGLPVIRLEEPAGTLDAVPQAALCSAVTTFGADIALILGDRFELLSVAESCTFAHVPMGHCSGGERTFGAFDDQIRDAVTKLAHLHFVSHEPAAARLISLQEEPWRIAVTGDPGLDSLLAESRMGPEAVGALTGATPTKKDIVIAFHPVTRSAAETSLFADAIARFCGDFEGQVFLSAPNGDPGSGDIEQRWREVAARTPRCHVFSSLGVQGFRGLVAACGALVGNSSSGVWEAPSLGTPSLDLGTRQTGRVRGETVLHCAADERAELEPKIRQLLSASGSAAKTSNPYGDGHATPRILEQMAAWIRDPRLMVKA